MISKYKCYMTAAQVFITESRNYEISRIFNLYHYLYDNCVNKYLIIRINLAFSYLNMDKKFPINLIQC